MDVNNPAVFNYVKSWQITGGNYLPNPNGATEQVNSIAIDNNKTLYAAVNVTMSGSFGYRPTVGLFGKQFWKWRVMGHFKE